MVMGKLDALLDRLKNDVHLPVALIVFLATSIYHFKTHLDLGPQYTNSLYAFYAFLGGHAFTQQKWGGNDDQDKPTS